MNGKQFSFGLMGLRGRILFFMAGAMLVTMGVVFFMVYFQVSSQREDALKKRGSELVQNLGRESLLAAMYGGDERKAELEDKLQERMKDYDDVQYIIVLRKTSRGELGLGGRPFRVFAHSFRRTEQNEKKTVLAELHLAQKETTEHEDAFAFTGEIRREKKKSKEQKMAPTPSDSAPAGSDDSEGLGDEEDLWEMETGEEPGAEPKKEVAEPPAADGEEAPIDSFAGPDETKGELWGYVCLGLSTDELESQNNRLLVTLVVVLSVGLLAFILIAYFASRRIYRRLRTMMDVAQRISEGDLAESIPETRSDEIGELADALNRIAGNLNDMIRKVFQVSDSLADAVERITGSTEEVVQGADYQVASVDETSSSMSEMVISLKGVAENVEILATSAEESSSSILEMAAANDEVADNISALASSVEQTTTSIEQMTQAIKEVAKSVEDLSTTTEQTSTSMREMDVSIGQVETNANETAGLSEEVRRDAERGSDAVKKTIQGISRISESTRLAFTAMEALGKKVQAIGQVLNVIDDVAEQTNLLALNAAIIAAQAGEHGKGFAVVADEIKDLAERTATSTSEIAELIRAVQTETKSVIESMQGGLKSVDQGVVLSSEAEQALRKILDSSTRSTQMVREIARATVEQARGSKVVTDAISRIAETVLQIASATGQQAKGSEQIQNSSERMKVITQHVHSSSQEQARGSKQITQAIENISEMVHHLNRAQKEQARGAEQVMKAVEKIKEVAEHHSDSMGNMKKMVDLVAEQAETLRGAMARFKL